MTPWTLTLIFLNITVIPNRIGIVLRTSIDYTTRNTLMTATSLIGQSTIDRLVLKIEKVGNFTDPAPRKLPSLFFETYCRANELYRVPVCEYACGCKAFVEDALDNVHKHCELIKKENPEGRLCLGGKKFKRLAYDLGERLYGGKKK